MMKEKYEENRKKIVNILTSILNGMLSEARACNFHEKVFPLPTTLVPTKMYFLLLRRNVDTFLTFC